MNDVKKWPGESLVTQTSYVAMLSSGLWSCCTQSSLPSHLGSDHNLSNQLCPPSLVCPHDAHVRSRSNQTSSPPELNLIIADQKSDIMDNEKINDILLDISYLS